MKTFFYCTVIICSFFCTSCKKQAPIPESSIIGTWALKGSLIHKEVQIDSNRNVFWTNYMFWSDKNFTYTYDANKNKLHFYKEGCSKPELEVLIKQNKKNKLSFAVFNSTLDAEGQTTITTDTYQKID